MAISRIIEFSFSFLVAFVLLALLSFLSLRPTLMAVRSETGVEWKRFLRAVQERNEILPGLLEAMRGFQPGHKKLLRELMEARSLSVRPADSAKLVAAVDDMDRNLAQVNRIVSSNAQLRRYPPFAARWEQITSASLEVRLARTSYNQQVRLYNGLLVAFPQNLMAAVFGYVPLIAYPAHYGQGTQYGRGAGRELQFLGNTRIVSSVAMGISAKSIWNRFLLR